MKWNGKLLVETVLPLGLRSASKFFSAVVDALQWITEQEDVSQPVMHYLDDFLFVGPPHSPVCACSVHLFLATCNRLGFPIA